ncbi:MAG: DNA-binding protein WhiA [Candidatus Eremiobacteraeota bacterium]|nr:DNA-binding protein WhiA [Candidatus Eremiobacteraeota bacterium]
MFSRDAKDEVASARLERSCCPTSFLRGLTLASAISRSNGSRVLAVASERASVARAVIAAAHLAGLEAHAVRAPKRSTGNRWTVTMPAPLGRTQPRTVRKSERLPQRLCCRRAWLRAAFLSCGSVSDPVRGYHLEFFCRHDRVARLICDLIAGFGVDAGITRRRNRPLVYVKVADAVSVLLGQLGANRAVLRLEGQRALKQTKNSIRRTVNSEAANAARAATSAARQREAATRVIAKVGLSNISPAAREAAQLRIAYPSKTLRELARAARPPITKAAMASRLRLLERMTKR